MLAAGSIVADQDAASVMRCLSRRFNAGLNSLRRSRGALDVQASIN
jgi:hypothetical protein